MCKETGIAEGSRQGYVSGFVKFGLGCLHRGVCKETGIAKGSRQGYVSGFVKFGLGCLHRGVVSGIFRVRVNINKARLLDFSKSLEDCLISRNLYKISFWKNYCEYRDELLETSRRLLAFSKSLKDFFLVELLWIQR